MFSVYGQTFARRKQHVNPFQRTFLGLTHPFALCELVSMTLKDYLDEQGKGALTRLAEKLDTSKGYLVGIRDGDRMPSVAFAKKIEAATGGEVTAIALLGLDRRTKRKAGAA